MKRNVFNCLLKEAREVAVVSDTGWKTVPRTSSSHTERAVTHGSESRSRYDQQLLTAGP